MRSRNCSTFDKNAFPLGGRCPRPRPRADEGRACRSSPRMTGRDQLSPHQSASRTASPPGEKLSAKRTDEGRADRGLSFVGCCGRLAPHPPSVGASGTFPQGGRHSYQTWNNSAISCSFSWEPMTQSLPVTSGPQGRISCSPGTMSNSYQVSPPSTMPLARRIMP